MSARTVFLTGITGFVGRRLARALAEQGHSVLALVRPESRDLAERNLAEHPPSASRVTLLEGDLRHESLLRPSDRTRVLAEVDSVIHCAGLADPAVDRDLAQQTIELGTARLLELAGEIPALRRFVHLSCASVAGNHRGLFTEDMLRVGQDFSSHADAARASAEERVIASGLPALLVRPSAIVGDSTTGEVDAQIGPTRLITALFGHAQHRPSLPLAPFGRCAVVDAVPVDFVVTALLTLWSNNISGRLHLADPAAPTVRAFLDALCPLLDLRPPRVDLPRRPALALYEALGPLRRLLDEAHNLPRPALAAMATCAAIDTTRSERVLRPLGLEPPPILSYLPTLVEYARTHLV